MSTQLFMMSGRAVADAETLKTKKDKIFTKFTVAVNEYLGEDKGEKAYFYDVLIFDKTAAVAKEKIKKGDNLFIQGRPEVNAYLSKKDKKPKGSISVIANEWRVMK